MTNKLADSRSSIKKDLLYVRTVELAENIRPYFIGVTKLSIAEGADVTGRTIRNILSERTKYTQLNVADRLCVYLGASLPDDFISFPEVLHGRNNCVSCGCDYNEFTIGCYSCANRKAKRRNRPMKGCITCGCDYDEFTPKCKSCIKRKERRRTKELAEQRRKNELRS